MKELSKKLTMGMDLGSRSVKIAALCGVELELCQYDTISFYREYSSMTVGGLLLDRTALGISEDAALMACGYGRQSVALVGGASLTEIEAHAAGACFQAGESDFLLLDIGGQDSKVVKVRGGRVADFYTNDKCAASGGRYLENMAQVLGLTLSQLAQYWQEPVPLSSTCAVFGESELIGKIAEGYPLSALAAGVNFSVVRRVQPFLARFLPAGKIYMSGGVALNKSVVYLLAQALNQEVIVLPEPVYNGAIGCAVKALEK